MDLNKFYDTVVLRDILEYTLPGSIVVTGVMLIVGTILAQLGIGFSFFAYLSTIALWQILVLLAISYIIGHVLTAFDVIVLRDDENKVSGEVLQKNEWLKGKMEKVFAEYTRTTASEIKNLLSLKSSTFREIGRAIIHSNQQELYREFVNRHSILSRLFKNMSIALTFLLMSLVTSSIIGWQSLLPIFSAHLLLSVFASTVSVASLCGMIWLFYVRSHRIRSTMIKHTFQILYADYIMSHLSKKKANK